MRELVDRETRWLHEQANLLGLEAAAAAERAANGEEGSSAGSGGGDSSSSSSKTGQATAAGAAGAPLYAPPNWAPGSTQQQQQQQGEEPAAVDPLGNVLDGNTEAAAYEDDAADAAASGGSGDAPGSDSVATYGAPRSAAALEPDAEGRVDSPWAAVRNCMRLPPARLLPAHGAAALAWRRQLPAVLPAIPGATGFAASPPCHSPPLHSTSLPPCSSLITTHDHNSF